MLHPTWRSYAYNNIFRVTNRPKLKESSNETRKVRGLVARCRSFRSPSHTHCVPNAVQRLAGVAVGSYEVTGRGGFTVRYHVRETGADAHVVVQFLRGTLGPRHHLLYRCRLAPAVLVRIEHDVVNLEGARGGLSVSF